MVKEDEHATESSRKKRSRKKESECVDGITGYSRLECQNNRILATICRAVTQILAREGHPWEGSR